MNGDQMVQVTRFAVALDRMARAAKANEPVELTADENVAMVATIQTLTSGIRAAGPQGGAPGDWSPTCHGVMHRLDRGNVACDCGQIVIRPIDTPAPAASSPVPQADAGAVEPSAAPAPRAHFLTNDGARDFGSGGVA